MRPRMRLQQYASHSVGGGLPLCLFGIGVHPRALNCRCHQIGRLRQTFRQNSTRVSASAFSLEDSINFRDSGLCENPLTEGRAPDEPLQERTRIALALQMAELDRRREAIRKQRSNRGFVNVVDEQGASVEGNSDRLDGSAMLATMQDPSIQYEFDKGLQHCCCAKAA